jgi:hypothetical protein
LEPNRTSLHQTWGETGSAHRYESENAARYIGYSLKERGDIEDFTVEEVLNPRTKR